MAAEILEGAVIMRSWIAILSGGLTAACGIVLTIYGLLGAVRCVVDNATYRLDYFWLDLGTMVIVFTLGLAFVTSGYLACRKTTG